MPSDDSQQLGPYRIRAWRINCYKFARMRTLLAICLIAVVIHSASSSRRRVKEPATTSRFHAGEVWTFHTTTNEPSSATLTIARVDFDPQFGPIVFVSVTGLPPDTWRPYHFMPLSEEALGRSVVALVQTNALLTGDDLSAFEQFYEQGRQGVQRGKLNKCFDITVAELLRKLSQPQDTKPWWRFW